MSNDLFSVKNLFILSYKSYVQLYSISRKRDNKNTAPWTRLCVAKRKLCYSRFLWTGFKLPGGLPCVRIILQWYMKKANILLHFNYFFGEVEDYFLNLDIKWVLRWHLQLNSGFEFELCFFLHLSWNHKTGIIFVANFHAIFFQVYIPPPSSIKIFMYDAHTWHDGCIQLPTHASEAQVLYKFLLC